MPRFGETDSTEPIVHCVKRNWSELESGTVCKHELGSIKELEPHDNVGTEATY